MDLFEYIISELKNELSDVSTELRDQMYTTLSQYAREFYEEIILLHTGEKPLVQIAPLPEQTPEVSA